MGSLKANPKFENRKPNMRAVHAQEQLDLNTESLALVNNLWIFSQPAKCKHSDILKNMLVNCTKLSFQIKYIHIEAHQDDKTAT